VTGTSFFAASTPLSVAEIVELTGAEPCDGADLSRLLTDIAPVDLASADDLSFVADAKFADALASTKAGAVLTTERFAGKAPTGVAVLRVRKPYDAFIAVARKLYPDSLRPTSVFGTVGIAPGAIVHASAKLGPGVTVDPGAVIGPRAEIGTGTLIGANAVIGPYVKIGSDCAVGAGCTVTHSTIGDRVIIHPGSQIGQDGFGYISGADGHVKVPQVGGVVIHNDVEIGSGTRVDRGGIRDTVIGEGTKIDNLCQIGHNCVIGKHCIIVAQSGLSGSVTLQDFVVLGARTGIIPHITVGKGAMLASRSTVYDNVPAGAVWGGFPAKSKRVWMRELVALQRLAARGSAKNE
jgi:UDP-3-O-[3-hydroxymyristoyl] glucosamine N-acyltransferase